MNIHKTIIALTVTGLLTFGLSAQASTQVVNSDTQKENVNSLKDIINHSNDADTVQNINDDKNKTEETFISKKGNEKIGMASFQLCVGCHGVKGEGGAGPKLAGQKASDIKEKLESYRAGKQRGSMAYMMTSMVQDLSDTDIANISSYIEKNLK